MPRVTLSDGAALSFTRLDGAEGAPVVLLHGVLDDAAIWNRVATRLHRAGRTVLLPEARGHGASEPWRPEMSWAPEDEADDLVALLEALAPAGAHLVGHSRGGTSAGWVASQAPERVLSLAVVASPPQASEVFRARFRRGIPAAADDRTRAALSYLAQIPEDAFPQHALRRYDRPALVVEAEDDPLYSPVGTMFWRLFLPYARFERVPGGHTFFASSEEGADWLADALLAHVRAAEGKAGP